MLALEISINDSEPFVVTANNCVLVSLSYGINPIRNLDFISVFGADDAFSYTWLDKKVQNGEKVLIRVVEVEKSRLTIPMRILKKNRKEIIIEFERLKKELQNKQLL